MEIETAFHHGAVAADTKPILEMRGIKKHFGNVIALAGVSFDIRPGECHCLLGDNGAGKSTFIKTMSGVHKPTEGEILFEDKPMNFSSPRDAMEAGIATVFQDLAMIPLMSVTRNFFMGREPTKGAGPFKRFDVARANEETVVVVQIETMDGIEHADEIIATDGVDVVFLGPTDLSVALGVPGQGKHEIVLDAIEAITKKIVAAGKVSGTIARAPEDYGYWRDRGVGFFLTGANVLLGAAATQYVQGVRAVEEAR